MTITTQSDTVGGWDYSPAPDSTKITIEQKNKLFIGGKFVSPKSRSWFASINPATEEKLADIACAGKADVDAAVRSAKAAQPKWSRLSGTERAKYLYRIARRIQERAREFAILETMDGGKPIKESRDVDIPLVAQHFFYYAGWADKLSYAFPGSKPSPVGVCAQITPWNFPLLMAAWKLAPALACGNTSVLKPAETTSLTALRLAEVFQEVGLPDGVANIVTGAGDTGRFPTTYPTSTLIHSYASRSYCRQLPSRPIYAPLSTASAPVSSISQAVAKSPERPYSQKAFPAGVTQEQWYVRLSARLIDCPRNRYLADRWYDQDLGGTH